MASNSLIPLGSDGTLQGQHSDGILIRSGAGLTVAQAFHEAGKAVNKALNFGYRGPNDPRGRIQDFFSGPERERALDELYEADWVNLTEQHKKLLKHCHDLLQYALPKYVPLI